MLPLEVVYEGQDFNSSLGAALGLGFFFGIFLVAGIICIILIASLWKVFTKAGKPGWAALIPVYDLYVLFDVAWGNGLLFLLTFIPALNVIVTALTYVKLAKVYGNDSPIMIVLAILFTPIFLLITGFGKSNYLGHTPETKLFPNSDIEDKILSFKI